MLFFEYVLNSSLRKLNKKITACQRTTDGMNAELSLKKESNNAQTRSEPTHTRFTR